MFDFLRSAEKTPLGKAGLVEASNEGKTNVSKVARLPNLDKGPTPIEKHLRWLIKNPPEVPFVHANITPTFAAELLTYLPDDDAVIRQRPYSDGRGRKYGELMTAGDWRETTVPIIFTKSGWLGDGQHRLNAIILAQMIVPTWLAFGDDDENFFVYDTGGIRTGGDIFFINHVSNHTNAAASARWVFAYEKGVINAANSTTGAVEINTPERLYRYYLTHSSGLQASMWACSLFSKNKMPSPSLMVALHYIAAQKNKSQAAEFFRKLATGVGFSSQRDPAYRLREHIGKQEEPPSRTATACWTVQAWNAMRAKKGFGTPKITIDGSFPRMI